MHYGQMAKILSCAVSQQVNQALASMELTFSQGYIMGYVAKCPERPCSRDIEKVFRLSHATVSGLLTRLEKKEFVEFRADDSDRRFKRVYLLPKGWQYVEIMESALAETEEKIVRGFSPEERETFHHLLVRAIRNMGDGECCADTQNQENQEEETNQ